MEHEIDRALVDDWNQVLPQTTKGLQDEIQDLNAMRRLRHEIGKTPEQIRAYPRYLKRADKVRFCRRPYKLVDATDHGRGPMGYAVLDDDMEREARPPAKPARAQRHNLASSHRPGAAAVSQLQQAIDQERLLRALAASAREHGGAKSLQLAERHEAEADELRTQIEAHEETS